MWLTEWLAEALDLRPHMRVLDLGCGLAMSSVFLRREFGVQVWATDLWFNASDNLRRARDAQVDDGVFPIHADARSLPFATEFFDAVVSIDSFVYYGTDDLYLNYLVRFLKPGGSLVACGSLSLFQGLPGKMEYASSKAGVAAVVRCLAAELGEFNIRANVVAPGLIITPMMGDREGPAAKYLEGVYSPVTPMRRTGYPEDFEGIGAFLCSDASSFITGETITVDGGYMIRA